jgi:hypothetical protein
MGCKLSGLSGKYFLFFSGITVNIVLLSKFSEIVKV